MTSAKKIALLEQTRAGDENAREQTGIDPLSALAVLKIIDFLRCTPDKKATYLRLSFKEMAGIAWLVDSLDVSTAPSKSNGPLWTAGGAIPALQLLPLKEIQPSNWNPRAKVSLDSLKNLIASIREKGILEPLLVRPLDPPRKAAYEIVCGERRYRAAKELGLEVAPCLVRPMSDGEALEASIVENLQREDVTELEEADAYRRLIKTDTGSADNGAQTVEEIARKVGKSPEYIYGRLKLLDLTGAARQALTDRAISAGHAVMYHKQKEWERSLKGAPWSLGDSTLLPAAGSCTDCPKHEGTSCHDPACFAKKQTALIELELKKTPELVRLSLEWSRPEKGSMPHSDWTKIEEGKSCKFARRGIIADGTAYRSEESIGHTLMVCTSSKCPVHHYVSSSPSKWRERQKKQREEGKLRAAVRLEVVKEILEKAGADPAERVLRTGLAALIDNLDSEQGRILAPLIGFNLPVIKPGYLGRRVEIQIVDFCKTPVQLKRALVAAALLGELEQYSKGERLDLAARLHGVNARAIEKRALALLKAKDRAKDAAAVSKVLASKGPLLAGVGLHTSAKGGKKPCRKSTPKGSAKKPSKKS